MVYADDASAKKMRDSLLEELEGILKISCLKTSQETQRDVLIEAFNTICTITAPKDEDEFIPINNPLDKRKSKIILQGPLGMEGAHTHKPGNVLLNLGKLFENAVEGGLMALEHSANPYLLVVVALLASRKLYKCASIEIKERHAMVIASLWKIGERGTTITLKGDKLLNEVNQEVASVNRSPLTLTEFTGIISDLDDLHCLRLETDGSITLIEKVVVNY
jgi:hypothetical protein